MEVKFTQVLKKELKHRILTRVAAEAGIPNSLLHDWHSGQRLPSFRNIPNVMKLARYLGLTLEELLFDSPSPHIQVIHSAKLEGDLQLIITRRKD